MLKLKKSKLVCWCYDLNNSQYEVLKTLQDSPGRTPMSVKQLVEKLGKDRTTIQKLLIQLLKKKLVIKRQINLDRGFMFVYSMIDDEEFCKDIQVKTEILIEGIRKELKKFVKNV